MREKEEATNALISLFGELVEFRNDFGGNHVKNVGKITELLLERLVTKTQKYNLSERDIFYYKITGYQCVEILRQ